MSDRIKHTLAGNVRVFVDSLGIGKKINLIYILNLLTVPKFCVYGLLWSCNGEKKIMTKA